MCHRLLLFVRVALTALLPASVLLAQDAASPQAASKIAFSGPKAVNGIPYYSAPPLGIADMNGDGKTDILTENGIYLGDGKGNFSFVTGTDQLLTTEFQPVDLNGDRKLDEIAADSAQYDPNTCQITSPGEFIVLLGDGRGDLSPHSSYTLPVGGATKVLSGDFNRDGKTDLAFFSKADDQCFSEAEITIFINQGQGNFAQGQTIELTDAAYDFVSGDFNGDGKIDFALTSARGVLTGSSYSVYNFIALYYGNGDGSFRSGPEYHFPASPQVPAGPFSLAAADLNGDKRTDLVLVLSPQDIQNKPTAKFQVVTLLSKQTEGFYWYSSTSLPTSPGGQLQLVDFNGDGKLDVLLPFYVVNSYSDTSVKVLTGLGGGKFGAPQSFAAIPNLFYAGVFPLITGGRPNVLVNHENSTKEPYALLLNESK